MSKKRKGRHHRSVENPNVPLNVALFNDEAGEVFGASKGVSGVRVSRKKALGYPAFWRGVNLIAGDIAKIPLEVYKRSGKNKDVTEDHPVARLIGDYPNRNTTAFVFRQTLGAHCLASGNGYAFIDRDGEGNPLELLLMDPDKVEAYKLGGDVWYRYTLDETKDRRIPSSDVLHFRGLTHDGITGYNVLQLMRDSMGTAIAARDYAGRNFRNDARPGGVITHPGKLTDVARRNMRESWERLHKGLENSHKIAILEEDAKFMAVESSARNAQLLESREFDAREVANILGVPSHKLGDPSKVAYNSLGEENQSYYNDTLSHWLEMWAQECTFKLMTEKEKRTRKYFCGFDYQAIQRANPQQQMDYAAKGVAGGLLTQNEGRAVIGWNANKEEGSDKLASNQAQNDPNNQSGSTEKPAKIPGNGEKSGDSVPKRAITPAFRLMLDDVAGRMVRRLSTHAERAAKAGRLDEWATTAEAEHASVIADAFKPLVLLAHERGAGGIDAETLARFVISQTAEAIGRDAKPDAIQWATQRLIIPQITTMIAEEMEKTHVEN